MTGVFLRVAAVSLGVSVLLAPLLMGRKRMERRYAPQTRWGLWLAVALVLLAAPWTPRGKAPVVVRVTDHTVSIPGPVGLGTGGMYQPVTAGPGVGNVTAPEDIQAPAVKIEEPMEEEGEIVYFRGSENLPEAVERENISLTTLAAGAWLAGAVLLLLWQVGRYFLARRGVLKRSRPVKGLENYAREICPRRQVRFYACPGLPGPMTMGLFRPVVLLPEEGAAPAALRHELYHIRRWDVAYKVLMLAACCLHWFNPLVWWMARAADRDVEACCDAAVVAHRDTAYKRAYGELLLTAAVGKTAPFATHFGGGKEQMRSRLTQLFRPGKRSRGLVCGLLAAAVMLSGLVACREKGSDLADGEYCAPLAFVNYPVTAADGGENYEALRLMLRQYEEGSPKGEMTGECIIDLAERLTLREDRWDPGERGSEDRQKNVTEFLDWSQRRNSVPLGREYLVLEVKDDEVVHMFWTEAPEGDNLYISMDYGFALELPEDWTGRYAVTAERDDFGTRWQFFERQSYEAEPGAGRLFTLIRKASAGHDRNEELERSGHSGVLGARGGWLYSIEPDPTATGTEGFREDYEQMKRTMGAITAEKFIFLGEEEMEITVQTVMPTLDYYDPERGFLLYHTPNAAYFHYGDQWERFSADQSEGRRVLWRCDVSEDGRAVYLADALSDGGREKRFYEWDIEGRSLKGVEAIPDQVDHRTYVSKEELFYSGFMNGTALLSNAIRAKDGSLVGLFIDEALGNGMEFLRLCGMTDGFYWEEMPFLTPELVPGPVCYGDYEWNFFLDLPEELYGKYVVNKAANFWGFYDKAAYGFGRGYLMGLWAEDSSTFRPVEETLVLGEKDGITYSLTFGNPWDGDGLPREDLKENYRALLAAVKTIKPENFDLSGVERTGGELWPLPYTQYGSDVVLRGFEEGVHEGIDIRATDEVTVQCMWSGVVVDVKTHPITGWQTVTVDHENGTFSQYGHLAAAYVSGGHVDRGAILGLAGEEDGRRWVTFSRMDGESRDTARYFDPLGSEEEPWLYRTHDFHSIDRETLTLAWDPAVEKLLQEAVEGKTAFWDVDWQQWCYANALPDSDGAKVWVSRYALVDMDNDTVPEAVLWLNRGENAQALGSIVLRYQRGAVYGYPKGYRSMILDSLKADGTYGWSEGASCNGWGRMDFYRNETVNTLWRDENAFYVNGSLVGEEDYDRAAGEQSAKSDVVWYSTVNPGGVIKGEESTASEWLGLVQGEHIEMERLVNFALDPDIDLSQPRWFTREELEAAGYEFYDDRAGMTCYEVQNGPAGMEEFLNQLYNQFEPALAERICDCARWSGALCFFAEGKMWHRDGYGPVWVEYDWDSFRVLDSGEDFVKYTLEGYTNTNLTGNMPERKTWMFMLKLEDVGGGVKLWRYADGGTELYREPSSDTPYEAWALQHGREHPDPGGPMEGPNLS